MTNIDFIRIPIYIFFSRRRTLDDIVGFSLDSLVLFCGLKPDWHKNKINDKCKEVLYQFINLNMFVDYPDEIYTCKHNDHLEVKLNYKWFDLSENFAMVTFQEIDKILNYNTYISDEKLSNISQSKILLLLSYIRVNKLRRTELQTSTHPEDKPEIFYKHYKVIAKDIDCSEYIVTSAIDILNQLEIIVHKNIDRYQDKAENWHTDVTLFADKQDGWEQELLWGEEYLKSVKKIKYKQRIKE